MGQQNTAVGTRGYSKGQEWETEQGFMSQAERTQGADSKGSLEIKLVQQQMPRLKSS